MTGTDWSPAVMLVDDEPAFVETMAKRLGKRELRITTALSGAEALEKLEQGGAAQTDVVILDVKMPGMDGLETLAEIKRRHPTIEVVMLTGHATVESAIEGMKGGAFDYLMKPCDMDLLMAKVGEAASKKKAHEAKILDAKMRMYALQKGLD